MNFNFVDYRYLSSEDVNRRAELADFYQQIWYRDEIVNLVQKTSILKRTINFVTALTSQFTRQHVLQEK